MSNNCNSIAQRSPPMTDNFLAITVASTLAVSDPDRREQLSTLAQALEGLNHRAIEVSIPSPTSDAFTLAQLPFFQAVFTATCRLLQERRRCGQSPSP